MTTSSLPPGASTTRARGRSNEIDSAPETSGQRGRFFIVDDGGQWFFWDFFMLNVVFQFAASTYDFCCMSVANDECSFTFCYSHFEIC
jgi:hypothetical protein